MAQESKHIKNLTAARDKEVTHRREVAGALAQKYDRAHTEIAFISIQNTIDAIDRAIADEKLIALFCERGRVGSRRIDPERTGCHTGHRKTANRSDQRH